MIYVYALTDLPGLPEDLPAGIDDRPVMLRTYEGLSTAITIHDSGGRAVPVTADNVWRHERVIESLMAQGTLLPTRFGTTFERAETLDAVLRRNADAIRPALHRVRGHVEMGVRVLWQPAPQRATVAPIAATATATATATASVSEPLSGRDYLGARAAERRRADALKDDASRRAAPLHDALAAAASAAACDVLPRPDVLFKGAYLVPREGADRFRRHVRQLAARHSDLRILGTGPWPPYHFVPHLR